MTAFVLYLACTIALLVVWHRRVTPLSAAAALVLLLLPFCFTGRALLRGHVYGPIDLPFASEPLSDYRAEFGIERIQNPMLSDLYTQMIPWQRAVRGALAEGEWPLWNRHLLGGTVLAANMQSAPYDPVNVVSLLLEHPQAITFAAAMTFFLAGLFTFAFARALGCGETAALFAAAAYAFCGLMAFFVGWPLGRAWIALPLVLLGVRLVTQESGMSGAVMLTAGFVFVILAGHPESILHVVTVGAAYGVFELAAVRERRPLLVAATCGVVALLLTAMALVPFFEAAGQTAEFFVRRAMYRHEPLQATAFDVWARAAGSLHPAFAWQPQAGEASRFWQPTTIRVGSVALTLALAALLVARKRRHTRFFAGLALVAAWIGLDAWPLAHLLHAAPLFDIALNERLSFAASFALAMLAAFAIDALPAGELVRRARGMAVLAVGVTAALGIVALLVRETALSAGVSSSALGALTAIELVPPLLLALLLLLRVRPELAAAAAVALLLVQRVAVDGSVYPVIPEKAFYPSVPVTRFLQQQTQGGEPYRMAAMHHLLVPNAAAMYGLEDVRGYEAMTFLPLLKTYVLWSEYTPASYNRILYKDRPFLSLMNVRYLIALPTEEPDEQWKLVLEDRRARVFENTRVLPRAFVPPAIRYEQSADRVLEAMSRATDFAAKGWITTADYTPHDVPNGPGRATTRRVAGGYEVTADMGAAGWVIVTEPTWRGWRAYIDGGRVETHPADNAFVGVFVPAGRHTVRLLYQPESFTRGRNVTLLTIVGLALFFVLRHHRLQKPGAVGLRQ